MNVPSTKQNIMVTAMLGDSVLKVRQLYAELPAGKASIVFRVLQATGSAMAVGGVIYAVLGQVGLASVLMLLGLGQVVYATARVRLARRSPDFTVGPTKEADLPLAHPGIPARSFPLVHNAGGQHYLSYTEAMSGHLDIGADRTPLQDLAPSGRAFPSTEPGVLTFPIPRDAKLELELGDNAFLIHSVSPAGGVGDSLLARMDWNAQLINGGSFTAHALVLFLVMMIPPDHKLLTLDIFNTERRLVAFNTMAREQAKEEIPPWLQKQKEEGGQASQAHKGKMGEAGDNKVDKKKKGRLAIKGPKKNKDIHFAKKLAEDAAKKAGFLSILGDKRNSGLAHLLSPHNSAIGNEAENAMGRLMGDHIGPGYGVGGLAPVGTGRGGGGRGDGIGFGGFQTIGSGCCGNGKGRAYARAARLRDTVKRASVPPVQLKPPRVLGSLSKAIIRRIVRRHLNEVKYCYQKELQTNHDLYGRIVISFTIAGNGQVVVSRVQHSTLNNSTVEQCITKAVRRWLFPKPEGGGLVVVSYPFVLRAPNAK